MTNQAVIVKRLQHAEDIPLPERMTPGASGCDVCAAIGDDITIAPGARALVPTGFCVDMPEGVEIQVRPRSGIALKHGVTVLNSPGTIDSDYRGEIKIILINLGDQPFIIRRGDRIAQLIPARVANDISFVESDNISETSRGAGGFGHTGTQ